MRKQPIKYDRRDYETLTREAKKRLDDMTLLALQCHVDPDKSQRIIDCKCVLCYYRTHGRIGGAAMTSVPCCFCNDLMRFGSTATDICCKSCAAEKGICKECGADLNFKIRRKNSF